MIHEFAPAKINLGLKVGRLGKDGYHNLESLVVFADTGDRLTFEPAPSLALQCDGPFGVGLATGLDNLVLRAARALQDGTGTKRGALITLHKTLPLSSGIGGGSADAAAALRGLNRFWNCGLSTPMLEDIGASIGADVPVCVQSETRFMRGHGEILDDVSLWPMLDAVLVNPGVSVPTKNVFSRFDATDHGTVLTGETFVPATNKDDVLSQLKGMSNNLTLAACKEAPVVGELLQELNEYPQTQLARLCGSGATCVALTASVRHARELAVTLLMRYPQYWVRSVQLGGSSVNITDTL